MGRLKSVSGKKKYSKAREFWRRYKRSRVGVLGLCVIIFFALIALFAPVIAPRNPFTLSTYRFLPPSAEYPFGTDDLGRDVFSGVIYGTRVSLLVGALGAVLSTLIGVLVGGLAGYHAGGIDAALMRITELFMVIPRVFFALVLVVLVGPSVWNVIFVIGILTWTDAARIMRAQFLSVKELEYVEAARALGVTTPKIIFREILPNASPPIIVNASLQVSRAILLEATLSFLGLGDPNVMSWGFMLNNAQAVLRSAWWMAVFPGLALFLVTLSANLVGDGVNDAFNPKLKER